MNRRTVRFALPFFLFLLCCHQMVICQSAREEPIVEPARSSESELSSGTAHVFLARRTEGKTIGKRAVIAGSIHVSRSSGILLYGSVGGAYAAADCSPAEITQVAGKKGELSATEVVDRHLPAEYALSQNFPNPFNPVTVVRYQLPATSIVKLTIYNILGQEIETIVDEVQGAGFKSVEWDASAVPSGLYFCRLTASKQDGGQTGQFTEVTRMMLLK